MILLIFRFNLFMTILAIVMKIVEVLYVDAKLRKKRFENIEKDLEILKETSRPLYVFNNFLYQLSKKHYALAFLIVFILMLIIPFLSVVILLLTCNSIVENRR